MKPTISIIVPTFQRPRDLVIAVTGLYTQTMLLKADCKLIIVDNDPHASAADAIKSLRSAAPKQLEFIALHEPRAGIANARNAAMEHVNTELLAFVDDDQTAEDPEWLEKLYDLHVELKPAVVFGPVVSVLPSSVTRHHAYFERFFGRDGPDTRGFVDGYFGCSNTLMDMAQAPKMRPLFDPKTNESGGEDDLLFDMIQKNGGRFAWHPDAPLLERVPKRRATLNYTLKRAMVYGQGPTSLALKNRHYHVLAFWACVGFCKMLWHGARAGLGYLTGSASWAQQLDLAVRGASKIMFWRGYRLYGVSALRDPSLIGDEEVTSSPGS